MTGGGLVQIVAGKNFKAWKWGRSKISVQISISWQNVGLHDPRGRIFEYTLFFLFPPSTVINNDRFLTKVLIIKVSVMFALCFLS